jgi:Asp-tRNA(Asn)/Glu-tRNA(Gln) amidotransferase A subunit family amidase
MKKYLLPLGLLSTFIMGVFAARFEITTATIAEAEQLLGIRFNESKRQMMLRGLEANLQSYNALHNFPIDNGLSPALVFNPLPPGFKIDQTQKENVWNIPNNINLPENKDELAFMGVSKLASLIKNKKISSEELTVFFINRMKVHADTLECLVTLTEERALQMARKADREIAAGNYKGPLHGIPYGVKDLLAVEGYKTTWGAMPYKDQVREETAKVVELLDEAGAVLIAKLTLGALAMGDVWFDGVTKNPWNLQQGSSGSSAGSASAVAAGLVPFAIGSETLGSIVSPSTRCGVTGLRPSYGRISRSGAMALSWTMDKLGPMARNSEDLAIVFDVIRGADEKDQSLINAPFNYRGKVNLKDLKIGYIKSYFDANHQGKEEDLQVLEDLKALGANLKEVRWDFELPIAALRIILNAEAAAAFDELTRSGNDSLLVAQGPNAWPNIFRTARFIPAVEYINANRIRTELIQQVNELMKDYDVIISPSFGGTQLLVTNLTGHPCLVAPNGFTENGSPLSISFIGNLFEEEKLIAVAEAWQNATQHNKLQPPYFAAK